MLILSLLLAQDTPDTATVPVDPRLEELAVTPEPPPPPRPAVLFVHGMYMTGASWSDWEAWFQDRGWDTRAPSWPGHVGDPEALRATVDPRLEELGFDQVVAHYRAILDGYAEPPLLVGHSMGGLVVQHLLSQGYGRAGVAIDSAPPKGVSVFSLPFLRANAAIAGKSVEPIELDLEHWTYGWAHTSSPEQAADWYGRFVVPESKQVGKAPTQDISALDFTVEHPPLLFVAGAEDRTIPAKLNRRNHAAWSASPSRADYVEFEGRTHAILLQPGWEEVAGELLGWVEAL